MQERKIGILISYLNIFLQTIIGFLYVPILLYYIGTSEYGLYQLIGSFIAYFSIMDFGLSATIIRFYTKYKVLNDKFNMENILAISMYCYMIVAILIFIVAAICYINIEYIFSSSMTPIEIESAKNLFLLLVFNIIITISTMIFRAVINAHEKFLFLKGMDTIQLILQPILVVLIIQEYPTALSIAIVQTILNILLSLMRSYYCFKNLKMKIKFHSLDPALFKAFRKLALSIFIVSIIDQLFFKTNQIILGVISGTTAVAIYAISSLIYMNYMAISAAISGVYLPHITEMVAKKESEKILSDIFIKIGRWQYFILALLYSGFIIFGKQFIEIWAGTGFEDAYWITLLIILPFTIDLIQNLGLAILQAQNKYNFRAKIYFCMGIFNLCLAIPLGLKYGGIGCAFATGLAMFIGNGLIMNYYYWRVTKLDIIDFWKQIGKITIGVFFSFTIGLSMDFLIISDAILNFIIKIFLYLMLYVLIMYAFFMNNEEKNKLKKSVIKYK